MRSHRGNECTAKIGWLAWQNDTRPRFRIGRFEECCAGLRDPNWFIVLKRFIDKIDDISFETRRPVSRRQKQRRFLAAKVCTWKYAGPHLRCASQSCRHIVGDADVKMFGVVAFEDVDVLHERALSAVEAAMRCPNLREPAFAKRLWRGSLRLLRYDRTEAGLPSRSLRSKRRLVGATGIEPVTPTVSR